MLEIYVDADGCAVKQEIYRVAERYELNVTLVANAWMQVPASGRIELVLAGSDFDAADNWIVEHVAEDDIVVTDDIPLASRCLEKGARVLNSRGRVFTEASIGNALATRELMCELRQSGTLTGGPSQFKDKHRSSFLHSLDEMVKAIQRKA